MKFWHKAFRSWGRNCRIKFFFSWNPIYVVKIWMNFVSPEILMRKLQNPGLAMDPESWSTLFLRPQNVVKWQFSSAVLVKNLININKIFHIKLSCEAEWRRNCRPISIVIFSGRIFTSYQIFYGFNDVLWPVWCNDFMYIIL